MRLAALRRLKITPDVFYDLTPAEISAMMEGENERELLQLQQTRMVASLIRNAHFKDPLPPEKFWPLPGDKARSMIPKQDPRAAFLMFVDALGGEVTIEANA